MILRSALLKRYYSMRLAQVQRQKQHALAVAQDFFLEKDETLRGGGCLVERLVFFLGAFCAKLDFHQGDSLREHERVKK